MISNLEIKNAKPRDKQYTINVDTGLSILVKPTGAKLWRFRYSFLGKRCLISIGKYPLISIKEAKAKQREYLDMLDKGINPSTFKKQQKIKLSAEKIFKSVALEWYQKKYTNPKTAKSCLIRLEKYVFPVIGNLPIKEIEAPMLFNLVEDIQEEQGLTETGRRVNSYCSMIFRYGVAKGYCSRDITQDYKGMLKSRQTTNLPALVASEDVSELLNDIDEYTGTIIVKTAMLISAYVFVRPNELANSKWSYIDFNSSQWIIPAELMKMNREHIIPFPTQVKLLLQDLYKITGDSEYIFPSARTNTRAMHSETVNKTIRKLKNGKYIGRMVSHGFRGMASTILNENKLQAEVKFGTDEIELQLAHVENNKVRGAYNHAEYLDSRRAMMQWYADYLDNLKNSHKQS